MHTMWKGSISFGLVNIPVKMFAATEEKDIHFRMLHKTLHAPIKYVKTCEQCEGEVPVSDIVKGYEYEPGHYVIVEEDELKAITPHTRKAIEIMDFVDIKEIDPIYFNKTYFLSPNETGDKAYVLLQSAMQKTGKIAIAKITIRSKQNLACVRVYENALVMETLYYPDEVREVKQVPGLPDAASTEVNEKELTMAEQLIEQLSGPFNPAAYEDEYRKQLQDLIQQKIDGKEVRHVAEAPRARVVDLMEALQASIEESKTKKATAKRAPAKRKKVKASASG
ncbi:Ku protein [Aneurinibacillus terranovensis]|uniref:non-homologous end joining protein Ku n=1 Tax=Aneurinibacillus terranovensis TaxID=278991 RepID=UPI000416D1F2|nr:Ku protein [Aneurinibacillus terranovensis]